MRFPIFGQFAAPSTSETNYAAVCPDTASPSTTKANFQIPVAEACTADEFKVLFETAPGEGKWWTVAVEKNGEGTVATAKVEGAALEATWTGSLSFAEGDLINISIVPSGGPASSVGATHIYLKTATGNFFVMGSCISNANTTETKFRNPWGASSTAGWLAEAEQQILVPIAATLVKNYVKTTGASGKEKSYSVSARVGSTDAVTAKVEGESATTASATGSQAVSAGDLLVMKCVPAGTPSAKHIAWCLSFTPTTPGQSFCGYGAVGAPSATVTNYNRPHGDNAWSATESAEYGYIPGLKVGPMYVKHAVAPGGATARTLTIRDAGANTAVAVKVEGAATSGNTAETATLSGGRKITVSATLTGSPAADTGGVHTGLALFTPQAKTIAAGQPSETDTAQALTHVKRLTNAQPSEIDTSLSVRAAHRHTLSQPSDAETAQAITPQRAFFEDVTGPAEVCGSSEDRLVKPATVHQVGTTETAQAMKYARGAHVGQATETETAQPVTARHRRILGQPSETDAPQAVTALRGFFENNHLGAIEVCGNSSDRLLKLATVSQSAETETAQPITKRKRRAIAQATEAGVAQILAPQRAFIEKRSGAIEVCGSSTDALRRPVALQAASTTDTAQPLSHRKIKAVGQAAEADVSQPISTPLHVKVLVEQAQEADTPTALSSTKFKGIGQASDAEVAQPAPPAHAHTFTQPEEVDAAQPLQRLKVLTLGQALEAAEAEAIVSLKTVVLGQALEEDAVFVMYVGPARIVIARQAVSEERARAIMRRTRIGHGTVTDELVGSASISDGSS